MMNVSQASNQLLYLYGIIQNSRELPAIPPPVEPIAHGKLVALVEPVPAAEFAPEVLETQFASLDWVARHAEKHEALVETAMRHGPVIPARFCTLFSSSEAVRRVLSEDEDRLWGTLAKLDGMAEWSIRAYCDPKELARVVAMHDANCQALAVAAASTTPGQAYVLSKRREAHIAYLADLRKSELQETMLDELDGQELEVQVKQLTQTGRTGGNTEMVANLVVLAGRSNFARLVEVMETLEQRYADAGFVFERTGPWPPYSFTGHDSALDEEEEAGEP